MERSPAIRRTEGLAENTVLNVLEDDHGWFWLNGYHGIHRVRKRELNELAEGKRTSVETISYGAADGLLSSEGNGGSFPNSCKTRDGPSLVSNDKGLVMINPEQITANQSVPPVWIDRIMANDHVVFDRSAPQKQFNLTIQKTPAQATERKLSLPPGSTRLLQIEFTAPVFSALEKTRFKFRLEGHDTSRVTQEPSPGRSIPT